MNDDFYTDTDMDISIEEFLIEGYTPTEARLALLRGEWLEPPLPIGMDVESSFYDAP